MLPVSEEFTHEYQGCDIVYGRGCVDRLGSYLAERGLSKALIVCGSNVAANDDLMDPIRAGLGDRLAAVFDGTTPAKRAGSALTVRDRISETDADVVIGIGGGSSLDIARNATVFAGDDRSLEELRAEAEADGCVALPDDSGDRPDVVVIPTTFAGADISEGGSVTVLSAEESPTGQPITVSGSASLIADFADPRLFETTPTSVLAGSAMNGFNKGVETPYSRHSNPLSDATAIHGLRLLSDSLPVVASEDTPHDPDAMDRAVIGALLVQIDRKISIVHAFGHAFARRYDVQQGNVHAVVVPAVLEYVFEKVDGSRRLLAEGFGVDPDRGDDTVAEAVIERVAETRDGVDVPTRARELPETDSEDIPALAEFVLDDWGMANAPPELNPTQAELEAVLRDLW